MTKIFILLNQQNDYYKKITGITIEKGKTKTLKK